jgi:hypothetical protein
MDWGSFLIITLLGLYSHIDAITSKGAPAWHYVYAGLLIAIAAIVVFGRARGSPPNMMVWGLIAIAVVGVPTAVQQRYFYPNFFLGDIAKVLAPVLFWWAAQRWPQLFSSEKSVRYLFWWLMSAALCAPLYASVFAPYAEQFRVATSERGRYDPPHPVLIAILWFYVLHRPSFTHLTLLGLCAALAFFSQQRTNLLIIPILGALAIALEWGRLTDAARRIHFWSSVAIILFVIGAAALLPLISHSYGDVAREVLFYTRFDRLQGGLDESGANRFLEARDVIYNLNQEGPLAWIVGLGHGATFSKFESNPESNVTDEGVVHHVHIGPQQILLRYGIVGVALLGVYGIVILARFQVWMHRITSTPPERIWLVALIGVGIMFVVFGMLQDPLLSMAVGASLAYSGNRGRLELSNRP